ncbi:MAG TPA: J domain-containing protein [Vicinamibacteria bacterium]|nr:J domain-containing protein [Vicinamibacteria bacterium]
MSYPGEISKPTRYDLTACYQILGLNPGSSLEAVRGAYRRLVRNWHPDQFMDDEARRRVAERHMTLINTAYKTLTDFLSFCPPFRFDENRRETPRERTRPPGRSGNPRAVSRFRRRTTAWWKLIRFSFEDPEFFGPSVFVFFKTMS